MGDNIIGRFFADRIDGIRMEFYVYANGIIVCSMYPDILMKRIYLKIFVIFLIKSESFFELYRALFDKEDKLTEWK